MYDKYSKKITLNFKQNKVNRGQNSVNNNKQCQDSKIVKSVSA